METLQDILDQTVRRWLTDGTILKESNAPLHAERIGQGKITRGSFRAYLAGERVPDQARVFEGLEIVTGVSQERLVNAAKKWERPETLEEKIVRLENKIRELEKVLAAAKAQLAGDVETARTIVPVLFEEVRNPKRVARALTDMLREAEDPTPVDRVVLQVAREHGA